MNVVVSSRHMDVTPAMKSHAELKANKLTKYYDRIQEIEVVFDANGGAVTTAVEMIVTAEHQKFVVREEGEAYSCIDTCMHKLERQLTEHKKKFRNRKHPGEESPRKMGA